MKAVSRPAVRKAERRTDRIPAVQEAVKKLTGKEIQISISEIKRPELDAVLVSSSIARQLEGRVSYRKAIKTAIASAMRMGAEGIKIQISGRLGGAEMARTEHFKEGRTPLHTLRADIDYALSEAHTTYGRLGIKVWICRGIVYGKRDLSAGFATASTGKEPSSRPMASRPAGSRRKKAN